MDFVKYLAAVLTEDPDVIVELDATMNTPMDSQENFVDTTSQPADAAELLRKATNAEDNITNKNRTQRQQDQQQDDLRKKVFTPQLRNLNKTMGKMRTGIVQNQRDTTDVKDQTDQLDRQMDTVNALMQQFEKNIL